MLKNKWLAIKQLDRQLKDWQGLSQKYPRPRIGWVKTLRVALCMTAAQLAERMGLSASRIVQLEGAEMNDAVTLRSLNEAAAAMGCQLIYAIVPIADASLESILKNEAKKIAKARVERVAHSMALEAQGLDANTLRDQKEALEKNLLDHLNKKFWANSEHFPIRTKKKSI